ncbi:conserved hypothetical protein [Culex quinquefasciatus]|uniref:Transmembrane protein n=1 Tax=Culex quinquefasciatus TaxID=7176 RepID=B0X2V0_CULQU|nr:conserved hypothetical protein [Culex quinquefasciatus]|eukprot:XP_001863972.1 conserved hypothetical protein [Culex quinquefasciatus]
MAIKMQTSQWAKTGVPRLFMMGSHLGLIVRLTVWIGIPLCTGARNFIGSSKDFTILPACRGRARYDDRSVCCFGTIYDGRMAGGGLGKIFVETDIPAFIFGALKLYTGRPASRVWKLRVTIKVFYFFLSLDAIKVGFGFIIRHIFEVYFHYAEKKVQLFWESLQIFKSSNLQIFKSSNLQIIKSSNLQIIKSSNLQIFKSSNLQIFKSSNHQIFKSSNLQIFKSSNLQIFKSSNLQIFK